MVRRTDLHPDRKLRDPQREMELLAQWPEQIVGTMLALGERKPEAHFGGRYWNFKIPVNQKLVEPPYATAETQRLCIAQIFAAAQAIETSDKRPVDCRVACLISSPSLFMSEVTVFFDEAYFSTFLPQEDGKRNYFDDGWVESEPAEIDVIREMLPPAPEGLEFCGGTLMRQYDPTWGPKPVEQFSWVWAFPRR